MNAFQQAASMNPLLSELSEKFCLQAVHLNEIPVTKCARRTIASNRDVVVHSTVGYAYRWSPP